MNSNHATQMFNPMNYKYSVTYEGLEGDLAILILKNGAKQEEIRIPKTLIPKELSEGSKFTLKMLPNEEANSNEYESLRKLLQDLIN